MRTPPSPQSLSITAFKRCSEILRPKTGSSDTEHLGTETRGKPKKEGSRSSLLKDVIIWYHLFSSKF